MNTVFSKRTKIVVTLGPATETPEAVEELILAGANVFRLNTSHGTMEYHREKIRMIKEVSAKMGVYVATLVDLQGPKIRIGNLEEEIEIKNGDKLVFEHAAEQKNGIIPVDYAGLADDVSKGSRILIDDGKLEVLVDEVVSNKTGGGKVYATVTNGGILKSRKGLNIPGSTASLDAVTPKDVDFIKFAVEEKADLIALSFVRKKEDVLLCKKYISDFGASIPVVSKLEKPDAIENLCEIISVTDAVMVARGDLGIELSPVDVPICQKLIIDEANKQRKPVIVATQMLESMINEPIPTRAESSDVANAILDEIGRAHV